MKKCLFLAALCVMSLLIGCKKDDAANPVANSNTIQTGNYTTKQIFVEPWGAADAQTEITGFAYDAINDQLFWIKSRWHYNNEIMRYKISTGQYDYVYSYQSQWDYGMRIVGNDLWLVKTYDTSIVKLSSLAKYPLSVQNLYMPVACNRHCIMSMILRSLVETCIS